MDARGAAESESGSALSAAPVGDEEDFRLPVDRKNLLKTACPAGAGPVVAARPKERIQVFPKNDHNLLSRR